MRKNLAFSKLVFLAFSLFLGLLINFLAAPQEVAASHATCINRTSPTDDCGGPSSGFYICNDANHIGVGYGSCCDAPCGTSPTVTAVPTIPIPPTSKCYNPFGNCDSGYVSCSAQLPFPYCCETAEQCVQAASRFGVIAGRCPGGTLGVFSAIGCIPVEDTQQFTEFVLRWAMGIAGGIAFLLIVYAGFMIVTSAGNPQRLQAGKELLTAAIMGLLLLIFGAYLLRLIGIQILQLPGFGP